MILIAVIILAPLSAAVLILLLRRFPVVVALIGTGISLLASIKLLSDSFAGLGYKVILPGLPEMPFSLISTPLTSLLSTMVAVIASLVLVYAVGYMKKDPEKVRFFSIMLIFIGAMQILVLAADWVLLLTAWELIGLSSYLLIGFWFTKPGVKQAATRAFLVTRSADLGLYIAIFILIASTGSSDIQTTLDKGGNAAFVAGLFLLLGAMGKSAQTPMHNWLQGAMAGPTPVSALLHSATLVAAGAILLIRTVPLLPSEILLIIGVVGGITTVITGLIALSESDLKRMLAASTSSQYGLMLIAIGAGVPLAALFHLLAHAAIKSSLFVGAGIFQHSRESTLFTKLAGIGRERPKIFIGFSIAALALSGIPPLSGFFSKDAIIAASLSSEYSGILLFFALSGTLLTGAYMARALSMLWKKTDHGLLEQLSISQPSRQKNSQQTSNPKTLHGLAWMGVGMVALVFLTIVLGGVFPSLKGFLDLGLKEGASNQYLAIFLGLSAALTGLLLGWKFSAERLLGPIFSWARHSFIVAGGFNRLLVTPIFMLANACQKLEIWLYHRVLGFGRTALKVGQILRHNDEQNIDGVIESIVKNTFKLGNRARNLQSGLIHKELAITSIVSAMIVTFILIVLWV